MARDMASWYFNQPTKTLKRLRSQKYNRLVRLRGGMLGYMDMQEIKQLTFALGKIDAVLASRAAQMELPE